MGGKHALVLGASGITGWAIVSELLSGGPDVQQFSRVTALTNRPLSPEIARWPSSPKLNVVSGINLLKGTQDELQAEFQAKVPNIETVTQLFFNSYKFSTDKKKESQENAEMLARCVAMAEALSPSFEFIVLPTGGKAYGYHLLDKFPFGDQMPLKESLPRIPEPYASDLFYYWQVDRLKSLSKGKSWTYCEIRPDMVVGFVPNNNAHCLAQILAIYLSLYAHVNGTGSEVPFPGNEKSWVIHSNDSSQDIVARFSIYASLRPDRAGGGRAFNVCDRSRPSSWSVKWPVLCSYFGLKGTGPCEGSQQPGPYIQEHRDRWIELAQENRLRLEQLDNDLANPGFQKYIMSLFVFERVMSLEAMREAGFSEEVDEKTAWYTAFDRFRAAKIIP